MNMNVTSEKEQVQNAILLLSDLSPSDTTRHTHTCIAQRNHSEIVWFEHVNKVTG